MKGKLLLLYIFLAIFSVNAQTSFNGYSLYAVGLEQNISKGFGGEFRFYTNEFIEETTLEAHLFYSFKEHKYHQFRLGAAGNGNLSDGEFYSLMVPLQLRMFPFQNVKAISFVIEIAPQWFTNDEIALNNVAMRHLWGIRYTFGREE